jgi:hypothetical protein
MTVVVAKIRAIDRKSQQIKMMEVSGVLARYCRKRKKRK